MQRVCSAVAPDRNNTRMFAFVSDAFGSSLSKGELCSLGAELQSTRGRVQIQGLAGTLALPDWSPLTLFS